MGSHAVDSYAEDSVLVTKTERCPFDEGLCYFNIRFGSGFGGIPSALGLHYHVIELAREILRDNYSGTADSVQCSGRIVKDFG